MRIPDSLVSLADEGIIEEVLRPLMSGKEAQVFLLRAGGEARVAKVYKRANDRSFKQRAEYTEGRRVRNSRDQRAMEKRSRHGREQDEAAWRGAEVDMIYRLHAAGVRVPRPYQFIDGVLIMELITDGEGNPAPRLGDVELDRESASAIYDELLREVVRMLCAGVVHGDLSDFNVLLGPEGPVIIDFPQAVHASTNLNARKLLLRDVDNLHRFVRRFVPEQRALPYGEEIWQLYQRGELTPDAHLTGRYRPAETKVDTRTVMGLIADARDEQRRRNPPGKGGRQRPGPEVMRARPRATPVVQQRRPSPPDPARIVPPPSAASVRAPAQPLPAQPPPLAPAGPVPARPAPALSVPARSTSFSPPGRPPTPSSNLPPSAAASSQPPAPANRAGPDSPPTHKRKRRRRRRKKSGEAAIQSGAPAEPAARSQRQDASH